MDPITATLAVWDIWAISWFVASLWSARTRRWATTSGALLHWAVAIVGFGLLFAAATMFDQRGHGWATTQLWRLPLALGWTMFALGVIGVAFTWWARLHLGRYWSLSVARKADHQIIDSGPYRLVRHPIYTGLIAAAVALAAEIATPQALAGAALIGVAFWIKARAEERFLRDELGEAAYGGYAARTPMLLPGWPKGR